MPCARPSKFSTERRARSDSRASRSRRRRNAGGAGRFAGSSLEELIDTPDDVLAGQAAERKRRPAPKDVLGTPGPLEVARIDGLCGDVGPVRMQRAEELGLLLGRSEYVLREAPVVMDEVFVDARLEVGPTAGESPSGFTGVDGAGEGERPSVEPVATPPPGP